MRGTSSSSSGRKAKPSAASSRASNPNSSNSANTAGESSVKRMWSVGESVLVKSKLSTSSASMSFSASGDVRQPSMRRGKILRLRSSGVIDIYYDNGEIEERVGKDRIEVDQLKGSNAKKAQPSAASGSRGTNFQAKGIPKSSSSSNRLMPTAKTSAKPTRAMLELQQISSTRPTTSSQPGNLSIGAQEYDVDQCQRAILSSSSYTQQQEQQQPRIQTSASGAGIPRKSRNDEEEHAILFSPVAAATDTATAGAPRRAKTADVSSSSTDRMAHNSQSASALGRSTMKSATTLRKQSAGRYSDMSEALAENQKQVTDILDTICDSSEDATAVVSARLEHTYSLVGLTRACY